jgi:hypothetical protein
LTALRRPAPAAPPRSRFHVLQNNEEESLLRLGEEEYNGDPTLAAVTPDFPFPVRIPAFLLNEHLHIRGKDFIAGIATSSYVDEI